MVQQDPTNRIPSAGVASSCRHSSRCPWAFQCPGSTSTANRNQHPSLVAILPAPPCWRIWSADPSVASPEWPTSKQRQPSILSGTTLHLPCLADHAVLEGCRGRQSHSDHVATTMHGARGQYADNASAKSIAHHFSHHIRSQQVEADIEGCRKAVLITDINKVGK